MSKEIVRPQCVNHFATRITPTAEIAASQYSGQSGLQVDLTLGYVWILGPSGKGRCDESFIAGDARTNHRDGDIFSEEADLVFNSRR
jgi:hypothetical protein